MSFDDIIHGFSELIYNGCMPSTKHDLLAGELIKARLLKASDRFDEALVAVNTTLRRMPDHPEALFLKAQILWEGFANYTAATACLKKVILMQSMPDETIRRWSQHLLKEILQHQRAQNGIGR
jgi:uncharacterized protein HemY